jgi:hypothetical protein
LCDFFQADSELAALVREYITKHREKLLVSGEPDIEQDGPGYVFLVSFNFFGNCFFIIIIYKMEKYQYSA